MSDSDAGHRPVDSLGIEQLIALNEEIAALARCGFPLGRGLLDAGNDLPGRLGRVSKSLGERLSRGESLGQALEAENRAIPPLYRAVVEAGIRAGRLPAALEGLAAYARKYADARRTIGLSMIYPVIVASFAYVLFLGFVTVLVPRFIETLEFSRLRIAAPVRWLGEIGRSAPYWWPIGPVLLVLLLVAWLGSGRSARFRSRSWTLVGLLPWSRSMLDDQESANFADLLALLIENGVPLPEALTLAGEASGDPRLTRDLGAVVEALKRGEPPATALSRGEIGLTPLVRWIIAEGQGQAVQVAALRNIASTYRKRSAYRAEKLQIFAPIVLLFGLGVASTLLYGLAIFVPLLNLVDGLNHP